MQRTAFSVTIGLVIVLISLFFTYSFISDAVLASLIGTGIGAFVYFRFVFPSTTVSVPPGETWLIATGLGKEGSGNRYHERYSGNRVIKRQWAAPSGLSFIFPWERPYHSVSMIKGEAIKSAPGQSYTLKGGGDVEISWRVPLMVLEGGEVQYAQTERTEIERRVRDRANTFFSEDLGNITVTEFGKEAMDRLKKRFENLFGGNEEIDEDLERPMGIWTGTPEITEIRPPKEVQQARNYENEMASVIRTAKSLVIESGDKLRFDDALKMALIGKDPGVIEGLIALGFLKNVTNGDKSKRRN